MSLIEYIKGLFQSFERNREQKRSEIIGKYQSLASQCNASKHKWQEIINKNLYINYQMKESWKHSYQELYDQLKHDKRYFKICLSSDLINYIEDFKAHFIKFDEICKTYNNDFIENEKRNNKELFDNIEGRALDDQQRECIVKDEVNNLVIAGAGSGKTTTIIGKVKYLLKRYSYDPRELLVLSFTNASSSEMAERIKSETGEKIDVMTFHKLGLKIIAEIEGMKPSLSAIELSEFVNEKFNDLTKQPSYNSLLCKYFLCYLKQYKSRFEFKNEGEYIEYLRDANIRTLNNQIVKSFEEMEIANFLITNNVKFEYEKKYEIDTRSKDFKQYAPDFYLSDYDIYIEHFGIDRDGNVPDFFEGKDGITAKEVYNNSIDWKQQLHKENKTVLIESYSYEKSEGVLTDNLKKKLDNAGVKLKPMTRDEIWGLIETDKANGITSFVKLQSTFICLLKSNNYSIEKIKEINKNAKDKYERMRNEVFIDLITPIFNSYEEHLKKTGDIDFNDMINRATQYVTQGKFIKKYSYIICDEYQDVSMTRYELIKAIKDKNKAKLFCVGDDWQSIMRFSGSEIGLFTNFEKYFGYTEKSYIETTYRFNKSLIELSSRFILKNKAQIKKELRPFKVDESKSYEMIYGNSIGELCNSMKVKMDALPENATIILLGRYNTDLEAHICDGITSKYDYHSKKCTVQYKKRKDLKIEYMTTHKSKGLQADYVFILNNTNKKYGFPSQVEDDLVLKLFSRDTEDFPFAEERRLFYVALTRAKKYVYLMVENTCKSPFIREIEEDLGINLGRGKDSFCPKCKKGELILKSGQYSRFYGCSNYPLCKYTRKKEG